MRKEKITSKEEKNFYPGVVQVTRMNAVTGEIFSESTYYAKQDYQNGSGFVLSYTEKMSEFLVKYSSGSVVRLFLYLAHHQQFGVDGVYGYRCSHKYLRQVLNLDKKTIYNAMQTLKNDFLVHELRVDGVSEFMVNPNYITIGKEKKGRLREWNLRWENTFKNKKVVHIPDPVKEVAPVALSIEDELAVIVQNAYCLSDLYESLRVLCEERNLSVGEGFKLSEKARSMFIDRTLRSKDYVKSR